MTQSGEERGKGLPFLLVPSQLECESLGLIEVNLGSNHYEGAEALKRGFNAGTGDVIAPEKGPRVVGHLMHIGLVTVMLWEHDRPCRRQRGKDRSERGMFCNFRVGKDPQSS